MKRTLLVISYLISPILYLSPAMAADVMQAQTISLVSGWNAVYIEVSPNETADEIFSSWPVEKVGYYNPAAFLETKQYSGSTSTEGTSRSGYLMWRRGQSALSPLQGIPAGIYVCFNTNAATTAAFSTTLCGTPSAPRITWHPSTTNEPMNLIGFSLAAGQSIPIGSWLNGFTGGNVSQFFTINGLDDGKIGLSMLKASSTVTNGQVVVMTCAKATDWSGALFVSPQYGIDFSTNTAYQTFSVRNDSARARPISITLGAGATAMQLPTGLMYRDTSHFTNTWTAFSSEAPFAKTLAAGETVELAFAVDRTKLSGAAGTPYGGLLTVKDETTGDAATGFRATVSLTVTSDGGASAETAWPKGVWLASGALDTVTFLETVMDGDETIRTEEDVKSGGTMKVRLPLYVDKNGDMTLLQRFIYGTDEDGVTHVYSPDAEEEFPVAIGNVKRVSSAVLPIDEPQIAAESGTFGKNAAFPFTVSENSAVNPYRHVYHPSHDGLTWEFDPEKPTPSGDDLNNYISTVKPEIFSVTNRITFAWDGTSGTAWNPEEKLSGNLTWELTGVRHEGAIRMKGRFTMKRISSATLDK